MSRQTPCEENLVVAVGCRAQPLLAALDGDSPGGHARSLQRLGIAARFPPEDREASLASRVYDLGGVGDAEAVFGWCRRAAGADPADLPPWEEPVEDRKLSPGQCRHLHRYHQHHGLLPAFWSMATAGRVASIHLVADLTDGAAALLPEVAVAVTSRLQGFEFLQVHAVLPPQASIRTSRGQADTAWAGIALQRLAGRLGPLAPRRHVIWLLRSSYADPCDQVAALLRRLTADSESDSLAQYAARLRSTGAWGPGTPGLWGTYACYGTSAEGLGEPTEGAAEQWVDQFLPVARRDLMRRLLLDWGSPEPWRRRVLAEDPGMRVIELRGAGGRALSPMLCRASLGLLPEHLPDASTLLAAGGCSAGSAGARR